MTTDASSLPPAVAAAVVILGALSLVAALVVALTSRGEQ